MRLLRATQPWHGGYKGMGYAKDREDEWLLGQFPADYKGYAVELGAVDGLFINCTKMLEERGWECLLIEPNPVHQSVLRAHRRNVLTCACDSQPREYADIWFNDACLGKTQGNLDVDGGGWRKESVTVLTLNQCLMVANFPRLDVLVLDVDGAEDRIVQGFDIDFWKPKCVIIEHDNPDRTGPFYDRGYKNVGSRADGNVLLLRGDA